jgi:hypothetical protein
MFGVRGLVQEVWCIRCLVYKMFVVKRFGGNTDGFEMLEVEGSLFVQCGIFIRDVGGGGIFICSVRDLYSRCWRWRDPNLFCAGSLFETLDVG